MVRVSIEEAARLTGVPKLEIARHIHSTRLRVEKGRDGNNTIDRATLRGINGYVPPVETPPPRSAAEPRADNVPPRPAEPEPDLWEPGPADILAIVKLDDAGRGRAIAELIRKHPHLKQYFKDNPLPPVFRKPQAPPPRPANPDPPPPLFKSPLHFDVPPFIHPAPQPPFPAPQPQNPTPPRPSPPATRADTGTKRTRPPPIVTVPAFLLVGYCAYMSLPVIFRPTPRPAPFNRPSPMPPAPAPHVVHKPKPHPVHAPVRAVVPTPPRPPFLIPPNPSVYQFRPPGGPFYQPMQRPPGYPYAPWPPPPPPYQPYSPYQAPYRN